MGDLGYQPYGDVYVVTTLIGAEVQGNVRPDGDPARSRRRLTVVGVVPSGLFNGDASVAVAMKNVERGSTNSGGEVTPELDPLQAWMSPWWLISEGLDDVEAVRMGAK